MNTPPDLGVEVAFNDLVERTYYYNRKNESSRYVLEPVMCKYICNNNGACIIIVGKSIYINHSLGTTKFYQKV